MSRSAGRLGWFLLWAVVFCDIGSSVYYVPGILYGSDGDAVWLYMLATTVAFVLLVDKVVEVARRFTGGGGVVSLGDEAFGPWWGCLGGQLILVDYVLTVAISVAAGVHHLDALVHVGPLILPLSMLCLAGLGALNIVGFKRGVLVGTTFAILALAVNALVIGAAVADGPGELLARIPTQISALPAVTPWAAAVGFAGAFLAFSGLESLAQLAPAMKDLYRTPRNASVAVIATVVLTTPVLTFLCTALLPAEAKLAHDERFVAELATVVGGPALGIPTALVGGALLLFAANTAITGSYHVQMALARREFLPANVAALSHRFQTPSRAIALSVFASAVVLLAYGADVARLGGLYAFGLLGSLMVTSLGVDVLRWRDGERGRRFVIGVATTLLVTLAFVANLVARPEAAAFGGAMTAAGMAVAVASQRGWFEAILVRIPRMAPPRQVMRSDVSFYTVEQAGALPREEAPGILVASRGATRKIFREARDRAESRGQHRVYLLYVDEIPGLFYPQLASPTPEGLTVLEAGCEVLRSMGVEPVPVWGLSHSAPGTVVDAAEALGCDTVVIGATQRTLLWHALRGRFIQELLTALPPEIRLIVVG